MATKKKAAKKAVKKAAAKKPVKKAAAKKPAKKAVAKKPAKKKAPRKVNAAFARPMTPSPVLAAVVGAGALPRTEVIKKLWIYIKKNGLQDAKNRRAINADDKLKAFFGGKNQVTMFDLAKLANKHLS
ncbi:MAG TPA: SWIB/MDM2 domain-containing protein [Gemmatimonadales bacterium]|nr:SWIB/MDM2 domain-containing protein [Gemmatimonadales bacterium]